MAGSPSKKPPREGVLSQRKRERNSTTPEEERPRSPSAMEIDSQTRASVPTSSNGQSSPKKRKVAVNEENSAARSAVVGSTRQPRSHPEPTSSRRAERNNGQRSGGSGSSRAAVGRGESNTVSHIEVIDLTKEPDEVPEGAHRPRRTLPLSRRSNFGPLPDGLETPGRMQGLTIRDITPDGSQPVMQTELRAKIRAAQKSMREGEGKTLFGKSKAVEKAQSVTGNMKTSAATAAELRLSIPKVSRTRGRLDTAESQSLRTLFSGAVTQAEASTRKSSRGSTRDAGMGDATQSEDSRRSGRIAQRVPSKQPRQYPQAGIFEDDEEPAPHGNFLYHDDLSSGSEFQPSEDEGGGHGDRGNGKSYRSRSPMKRDTRRSGSPVKRNATQDKNMRKAAYRDPRSLSPGKRVTRDNGKGKQKARETYRDITPSSITLDDDDSESQLQRALRASREDAFRSTKVGESSKSGSSRNAGGASSSRVTSRTQHTDSASGSRSARPPASSIEARLSAYRSRLAELGPRPKNPLALWRQQNPAEVAEINSQLLSRGKAEYKEGRPGWKTPPPIVVFVRRPRAATTANPKDPLSGRTKEEKRVQSAKPAAKSQTNRGNSSRSKAPEQAASTRPAATSQNRKPNSSRSRAQQQASGESDTDLIMSGGLGDGDTQMLDLPASVNTQRDSRVVLDRHPQLQHSPAQASGSEHGAQSAQPAGNSKPQTMKSSRSRAKKQPSANDTSQSSSQAQQQPHRDRDGDQEMLDSVLHRSEQGVDHELLASFVEPSETARARKAREQVRQQEERILAANMNDWFEKPGQRAPSGEVDKDADNSPGASNGADENSPGFDISQVDPNLQHALLEGFSMQNTPPMSTMTQVPRTAAGAPDADADGGDGDADKPLMKATRDGDDPHGDSINLPLARDAGEVPPVEKGTTAETVYNYDPEGYGPHSAINRCDNAVRGRDAKPLLLNNKLEFLDSNFGSAKMSKVQTRTTFERKSSTQLPPARDVFGDATLPNPMKMKKMIFAIGLKDKDVGDKMREIVDTHRTEVKGFDHFISMHEDPQGVQKKAPAQGRSKPSVPTYTPSEEEAYRRDLVGILYASHKETIAEVPEVRDEDEDAEVIAFVDNIENAEGTDEDDEDDEEPDEGDAEETDIEMIDDDSDEDARPAKRGKPSAPPKRLVKAKLNYTPRKPRGKSAPSVQQSAAPLEHRLFDFELDDEEM